MRFNDLLHLIAFWEGAWETSGIRFRHCTPRCRIPVRFPSPQTNFSP